MIEAMTKEWPFAVIEATVKASGTKIVAAAAFCFTTEDGFAFVDPQYLDPNSAGGHFFHRIEAEISPGQNVLTFDGPDLRGTITRYTGTADQILRSGVNMEGLEQLIAEQGRTIDEEREQLQGLLQVDLRGRMSDPFEP